MSRRQSHVSKKCLCCETMFSVHAYRAESALYCSRPCYRTHRFKCAPECAQCGGKTVSGSRYCSDSCRKSYWLARENLRRPERRQKQWDQKLAFLKTLGGACVACGIADPRVLEIDHIDPAKKIRPKDGHYTTQRRLSYWRREKGNVQILCANCHRLKTHAQSWGTEKFLPPAPKAKQEPLL